MDEDEKLTDESNKSVDSGTLRETINNFLVVYAPRNYTIHEIVGIADIIHDMLTIDRHVYELKKI